MKYKGWQKYLSTTKELYAKSGRWDMPQDKAISLIRVQGGRPLLPMSLKSLVIIKGNTSNKVSYLEPELDSRDHCNYLPQIWWIKAEMYPLTVPEPGDQKPGVSRALFPSRLLQLSWLQVFCGLWRHHLKLGFHGLTASSFFLNSKNEFIKKKVTAHPDHHY